MAGDAGTLGILSQYGLDAADMGFVKDSGAYTFAGIDDDLLVDQWFTPLEKIDEKYRYEEEPVLDESMISGPPGSPWGT